MISDKAKALSQAAKEMDTLLEDSQRIFLAMRNCTETYTLNMRKHSQAQERISIKLAALQELVIKLERV